jgi:hypothetical protein
MEITGADPSFVRMTKEWYLHGRCKIIERIFLSRRYNTRKKNKNLAMSEFLISLLWYWITGIKKSSVTA